MNLKPYPEYKDSGVQWLGDVPKHWEILPNRTVFAEVKDRNHPDEDMLSVTIKKGVIRQKALLENSSKKDSSNQDKSAYKLVCPNDSAYNKMRAWQCAIGVSDFRGIISPAYVVMRQRGNHHPRYFHHLYRTPQFAKEAERWSYGITSDMWSLRPEHFKMIYSPLPTETEQLTITYFLDYKTDQITRFIKAKKRMIELLKEQKQVIINDAVTGKIDVATGKPYPKYKDSGVEWLGQVPEGWSVYKIKQIALFNPSKIETKFNSDSSEYVTFLPMEKVSVDGKINCSIKMSYKNVCNGFSYFRKDDVVVAKITPCFENGKGAFLNELDTQYGFGTTEFITIRPNNKIAGKLLRMILSSKWFLKIGEQYMSGSAGQKRISVDFIKSFKIGVPSLDEQHKIVHYIETKTAALDLTISRTEREIALMQEYRTRLISDVVTGKIDVRDIEIPDVADIDGTIDESMEEPEGEEALGTAEGEE